MFHPFLSDDRKQDSATTTAHRKIIIKLLKQRNIMLNTLSTIWENTDGCADHYRCATALYLMSMLSQAFFVIIDYGISVPGHGIELVDGINDIYKRFLFQSISTFQLPGKKGYDTRMIMQTGTHTPGVSLSSEFQKHLSTVARKHGGIDQGK